LLERLATDQVAIWTAVLTEAVQQFQVELAWLREDTPSTSFEGTYEDGDG
jgi:hypothetical protein